MHGDLFNGVLFNRQYRTHEHQPVLSNLLVFPGYQQCQQFHPNVYTSHDESPSPSESPSGSSGSGSENVKRWQATKFKNVISAYKDHHENIKNSKSSQGKNLYGRRFLTLLLNIARRSGEHYSKDTRRLLTTARRRDTAKNLLSSLKLCMDFLGALTKFVQNL